jgi:general secretion pathway protein D
MTKGWLKKIVFGCKLKGIFFLLIVATCLQSCTANQTGENLLEDKTTSRGHPVTNQKQDRLSRFLSGNDGQASEQNFDGFTQQGNDQLLGHPITLDPKAYDKTSEDVMLNLVAATIPQAAKAILGDVLELDYSVDARVVGAVTLQTPKAISREKLLQLFESILRDNGAAIVQGGGTYRIVPLAEATRSTAPLEIGTGQSETPGVRPQIVPLRFVSADNMREVLDPLIPQGMLLRADAGRNALILSGTPREIAAIKETISIFDVDWMRGMSFALVPVKSSSPASIVQDLEQVFDTRKGPLKGILKFVPNNRLRSVLVISSRSKYLRDATHWIKKIDVLAQSSEDSLHVYHIQNRNAADLAKILETIFENGKLSAAAEGSVAPKYAAAAVQTTTQNSAAQVNASGSVTGGPETPSSGLDATPVEQDSQIQVDPAKPNHVRIVADDANNALLIYCSDAQFERIQSVLQEIDSVPNQVLLEAVIAEVSLDDDLKFGVKWFLGQNNNSGTFSDATNGAVSSVFPGFSYFMKANDIAFSLNAISSVTNVRVLSAPSMVVLDNKQATLQVGDQVPIVTQSAQGVASSGAPIVSNVELKDTGVILKITPRVNDSGVVTLDIEQEVSSVVKTTTSGIDSPTIRQRKMKTSVVVNDNEALALGGLIQEKENTTKSKVPVLGDIPVLGAAFRQKNDAVSRTELIMFIRPRVIRDMNEARQVTAEFRKQLTIQAPRVPSNNPTAGEELTRIFN